MGTCRGAPNPSRPEHVPTYATLEYPSHPMGRRAQMGRRSEASQLGSTESHVIDPWHRKCLSAEPFFAVESTVRFLLSWLGMMSSQNARLLAIGLVATVIGCQAATGSDAFEEGEGAIDQESSLTASQRQARAADIRDAAYANGIETGFLLAGIADAETQMAHCWSELTWACKGPASADCGGGPVVAGAGDGACSLQQGGLGMFQFDAGTFSDTLAREGNRILTIDGNVAAAVDFVVKMVRDSAYVAGVNTDAQAIAWLNGVRIDNSRFDPWVKTVTRYYNGCQPGWSCWSQRYAHYRDHATGVWYEMGGSAFWFDHETSPPPVATLDAIEVYWYRQPNGTYNLRALAPSSVHSVVYRVDGYELASATRADGNNFPASYAFTVSKSERLFEVLGYDAAGKQVGLGVGLMDVTDGTAVFIKQMGDHLYEIGLERPPSGVAAIEVKADQWVLADEVSGKSRSDRLAVRYRFSELGSRHFEISTYNADGSYRGTLRRDFNLR